jgi:DNA repair protein RadA
MHTSSTVYESLEYVQNITSDTLEKLRKLHIESVSQLAVQSPRELAIETNDNDETPLFDVDSASQLISNARKLLTENGVLAREFSTADLLLARRNKLSRYSVGSDKFDAFLNGGFETQAVTEIAGEFGSGKSRICHTLCVAANTLLENDRLGDETNNGNENKHTVQQAPPSIIFIDTENTFRADRIYQIAEQKGLNPETILTRIYHCRIYNSLELELIINNLGKSIEQYNARLVIVDSIISLHRAEFSGRETLAERQQRLGKLLNKLRKYADVYNIAVVVTNQVISSAQSSQFGLDSIRPAGGNIMGHGTTYR